VCSSAERLFHTSRLLGSLPELLHSRNDVFRRFDAWRKLYVKNNLRRTKFLGCPDVLGDLLEGAGKVDAVFLNGSVMNLDIGADDECPARRDRGRRPSPCL